MPPTPGTSPRLNPVTRNRWVELSERVQNTVVNEVGIAVYNHLVLQRIVNTYGEASGYDRATRSRAAQQLDRVLDHRGPGVFMSDVHALLSDPQVRDYLVELRTALAAATPQNPVNLWQLTLARAGSEREATRWIACLLQDISPEISEGKGFVRMINDERGRELLIETVRAVAGGVQTGSLRPFPPGFESESQLFYHYYVPRQLAQRLVDEGVPRNLAFLAVGTFNLEYELLAPALLDQRHDAVLEDVTRVFVETTGISRADLDARVAALRQAGEVNAEFVFADLDFERDLRMSPEQIERFIGALGTRLGLAQQLRDAAAPLDGKTLHRMTQMVTASQYAHFFKHKSIGGLYTNIIRPGTSLYNNGVERPVLMTSHDLSDVHLGFAGAAGVLPGGRLPFPPQTLTAGLLRMGPKPFMRQMYQRMGPTPGDQLADRLAPVVARNPATAVSAIMDAYRQSSEQARSGVEQVLVRQENPRAVAGQLLRELASRRESAPEIEAALRRHALVGLEPPATQDRTLDNLVRLVGRADAQVPVAVVDQAFNTLSAAQERAVNRPRHGVDLIDGDDNPFVEHPRGQPSLAQRLLARPVEDWTMQHGTPVIDLATRGSPALVPIPIRSRIEGVAAAIQHAARNGARVVNISQEMVALTPADLAVFRAALRAHPDVLVVMAAGNEGRAVGHVANDLAALDEPNFVKVAAATSNGRLSQRSSFHPSSVQFIARGGSRDPHLYADRFISRGTNALALGLGDDVETTSHAAPTVANVAAKVRLLAPHLSAAQVVGVLARSADTNDALGPRSRYGVIDPELALALAATLSLTRAGTPVSEAVRRVAQSLGLRHVTAQRLALAAGTLAA